MGEPWWRRAWNTLRAPETVAAMAFAGGGFLVGCVYTSARYFDPWVHNLVGFLDHWQTLIAGGLAIAAAILAYSQARKQIDQAQHALIISSLPVVRATSAELDEEATVVGRLIELMSAKFYNADGFVRSLQAKRPAGQFAQTLISDPWNDAPRMWEARAAVLRFQERRLAAGRLAQHRREAIASLERYYNWIKFRKNFREIILNPDEDEYDVEEDDMNDRVRMNAEALLSTAREMADVTLGVIRTLQMYERDHLGPARSDSWGTVSDLEARAARVSAR